MSSAPRLRFRGDVANADAVVLLLHGGTERHHSPVRAFDPAVLRLVPFGRSVVRAGQGRIALASLRYAVRGWNGRHESPLPDALWALDRIGERFRNLPVGLVGHSMGGRVALRVGDHARVRSVAALAPWLPGGEPIPALGDRKVLLAHGTSDRITDPKETAALAGSLGADGVDVELYEFIGGRHAMLFPAKPWHDLVAEFMVRTLLAPARGALRP
ncbi:MAG: alpha/beta hydrolase [Actinomycetota bacterium]